MTGPPTNISADRDETQMKSDLDDFLQVTKEQPGGFAQSEMTISSGSITPTGAFHSVDTEADASTDDLDNAVQSNHPGGRWLVLTVNNVGRIVTIKEGAGGAGQFLMNDGNDFILNSTTQFICFARVGTNWVELFRTSPTISRALIQDEKATTTDGGTFTSGAWQKRDLQTEVYDPDALVTLSASTFKPVAGTYLVTWRAPARSVSKHQSRLYNTTGAAVVAYGMNSKTASGSASQSVSEGSFVIDANGSDFYEIQHQCETTKNTTGFGEANSFGGTEVYSSVLLEKIG